MLAGRCWEEGGAPAYWPWIQVVRAAGGDFEEIAAPSAGAAVEQTDPESVRFALFDAVTRFLLDRADERPVLIVLEDLHAADEASLLLLRFLGEAIASAPIAVLCSYRDEEPRVRELASLFAGLARIGRRLQLRGLSQDEVEAYVARVVGEDGTPLARHATAFDHRRQPVLPRRADPRRRRRRARGMGSRRKCRIRPGESPKRSGP